MPARPSRAETIWVVVKIRGPFLGTLNIVPYIIGTQKGTMILTTTHIKDPSKGNPILFNVGTLKLE